MPLAQGFYGDGGNSLFIEIMWHVRRFDRGTLGEAVRIAPYSLISEVSPYRGSISVSPEKPGKGYRTV